MTTARRIDGKKMAADLSEKITRETATLLRDHGIVPGLAVIIIGEDPASQVYVRNKKRTAEACGFHSVQHTLAADSTQDAVLALIDELNNDNKHSCQHQPTEEKCRSMKTQCKFSTPSERKVAVCVNCC